MFTDLENKKLTEMTKEELITTILIMNEISKKFFEIFGSIKRLEERALKSIVESIEYIESRKE